MLEIIHDIAPGSDLLFHTGLGGVAAYANGITSLAAAGADVIVDDLAYLNEPMFQDGVVAQAVDSVVASGVSYYSAAGNQGRQSYESPFVDSGEDLCIDFITDGFCDPIYELVGDMHDFDPGPGIDPHQSITVPVGSVVSIAMQWDEPFGNVNTGDGSKNDHIILLLDETGGVMIEISANDNVSTGEPWEVLQYFNDGSYGTSFNVVITYDNVDSIGPPANLLKTIVYGSDITINEFPTDNGTVVGHANAAGAMAVGAAFYQNTPEYGTEPPVLEVFSSAGGTPVLFDTNGNTLPSPEVRLKPEIVAIDGVNTSFFFDDRHGGDGIPDFFGTSAAAPHAAGVAALLLQAKAGASPAQVNASLKSTAIDMDVAGFDYDTGYGLIQADAAIADILAADNIPPVADFTYAVTDLTVGFTDQSTDLDGNVVAWNWSFGDGNTTSTQNPLHTFTSAGTYPVTLTVTDDGGDVNALSKDVTVTSGDVNSPPTASFSYTCSRLNCQFDGSSSADDDGIVSYTWTFEGIDTEIGDMVSYTYASQGSYTATLEVADAEGETATASATFRVKNRGDTSGTSESGTSGGDTGGGDSGGSEKGRKKCTDGIDNDADGLIDGADSDCQ